MVRGSDTNLCVFVCMHSCVCVCVCVCVCMCVCGHGWVGVHVSGMVGWVGVVGSALLVYSYWVQFSVCELILCVSVEPERDV